MVQFFEIIVNLILGFLPFGQLIQVLLSIFGIFGAGV